MTSREADVSRLRATLSTLVMRCLGRPYERNAAPHGRDGTFDSGSLVQYVYAQIGFQIPRHPVEQACLGRELGIRDTLVEGDLVFTRNPGPVATDQFPKGVGGVYIVTADDAAVTVGCAGDSPRVLREDMLDLFFRDDIETMKRFII